MITMFSSEDRLRNGHLDGLNTLTADYASKGDIGAIVVVSTNIAHDSAMRALLQPKVLEAFRDSLNPPLLLDGVRKASDDDLVVFLRIAALGLDKCHPTESASRGVWRVQFNELRRLRPRRGAGEPFVTLRVPYGERFNFNLDRLAKECISEETDSTGERASLFFNKFPFAGLHTLVVPRRTEKRPQFMDESMHLWVSRAIGESQIPGFGMGYNAVGAYASAHHFHLQAFVERAGLPVMNGEWTHNGGSRQYPVSCSRFTGPTEAWNWIAERHHRNQPYNLVYVKGATYCFIRKPQLTYQHASWTTGFAWFELAGCMIVNERNEFEELSELEIEAEFAKLRM